MMRCPRATRPAHAARPVAADEQPEAVVTLHGIVPALGADGGHARVSSAGETGPATACGLWACGKAHSAPLTPLRFSVLINCQRVATLARAELAQLR